MQEVNASVKIRGSSSIVRGTASDISDSSVSIQSTEYIPPRTKVETLLFMDKIRRIQGEVAWSVADSATGQVVYNMGIAVESVELMAQEPDQT